MQTWTQDVKENLKHDQFKVINQVVNLLEVNDEIAGGNQNIDTLPAEVYQPETRDEPVDKALLDATKRKAKIKEFEYSALLLKVINEPELQKKFAYRVAILDASEDLTLNWLPENVELYAKQTAKLTTKLAHIVPLSLALFNKHNECFLALPVIINSNKINVINDLANKGNPVLAKIKVTVKQMQNILGQFNLVKDEGFYDNLIELFADNMGIEVKAEDMAATTLQIDSTKANYKMVYAIEGQFKTIGKLAKKSNTEVADFSLDLVYNSIVSYLANHLKIKINQQGIMTYSLTKENSFWQTVLGAIPYQALITKDEMTINFDYAGHFQGGRFYPNRHFLDDKYEIEIIMDILACLFETYYYKFMALPDIKLDFQESKVEKLNIKGINQVAHAAPLIKTKGLSQLLQNLLPGKDHVFYLNKQKLVTLFKDEAENNIKNVGEMEL